MTPKTDKTNRELILEVHQGIYGVPHTEDKGLYGEVKEVKELLTVINGRVRKNEKFISKAKGIAIGLGIVGSGGLGIGIWQIFG